MAQGTEYGEWRIENVTQFLVGDGRLDAVALLKDIANDEIVCIKDKL